MNLKELAAYLNLSQTTVSRALNGFPEVSEATRKRVAAAAEQHNYRPNTRAKALATGRAMAIGHVIPLSSQHEMVNPIFGDFIAGAGESYAAAGYDMVLSLVEDKKQEKAYREMASKRNVDGIVLHAPRMSDPRIGLLREIGLPFAVHGRASDLAGEYCWLDVNNKSAFDRATRFLIDLGHRRICLVNGLESMDFAWRRRAGYEYALKAAGLPLDPALMYAEEMTESYGYRTVVKTQAMVDPPTAYLVSSIIPAMGVRRAIEDSGRQMGREISVITHDDDLSYLRNGDEVPQFTATVSSVQEAGRQLANLLLDQIRNPGQPLPTRLLEAQLTVGRSTGPAPTLR
ncbi:transcriptional regulator, lacI family [Phaeobacter inhibens]|uniref:LacI family DNA-binding transcriptional regulator n=1 Tax=Phaeobacter inhibens TaxID=221822 RepID=UPI000C9A94DB|nr:substrate-binding domain-containing protein [Phaeobacter inhibens]AUR02758.1 transcriptional regulator, lacI family [Phaeobacter inhibens]UWR45923.1 substrate-binding domain-containing protein [Phaeobacter inhibens]